MKNKIDDNPIKIHGDEKDLEAMLKNEITRVAFMENVIKGLYQKKVKVGQGTIDISLTPSELTQLIHAESQLIDLRRKINGVLD